MIKSDIANEGVNAVVVAACSQRVMYDVFNYGMGVVLERVNIREHVAWGQPGSEMVAAEGEEPKKVYNKATQMMADDYVRMGIAKAQKMDPAEPLVQDLTKTVMVVGGGITGMKAALESSSLGYKVILVEKTGALGGWNAKAHKQLPTKAPFTDLEAPIAGTLSDQVKADGNIKVYLNAEVTKTFGAPGKYDVTITAGGSASEEKVGT
ncbi:MAG TPA: FAD-dependent oxidoreductase, partial [Verrucomicrobiae bacterium]